ncbi:UNVERIFIED_CONTAM: hypothetical protein GTU68_032464 [Idotea baltica]|nr:hypothetical protein [Idotea baltica]
MTLRVNSQKTTAVDYLAKLEADGLSGTISEHCKSAIRLAQPVSVTNLAGFDEGECSVQDEAAQWAAEILAPKSGLRILDACAAPGGKTCHLLELAPDIGLTALDLDETRVTSIENNLERLQLNANVVCADAADTKSWWDGEPFDRILIDAPCSGTGVIRRHPDIKLLRRESDIAGFAEQQSRILQALWPLLKPDGLLLYVTCSIMPAENEQQIQAFLSNHTDAALKPMDKKRCVQLAAGMQSLPSVDGPDGFYFALLGKS